MTIEVKNLSKKFNKNVVLENVNMKLENGNIYGLSGRNGSGKSVFLKILCGLYKPTTGEILFDGQSYNKNNLYVPNMRALIEGPNFFPELTGYENLLLLAKIQNKIGNKEIEKSLRQVNLYKEKDKKYSEYSLGMKQKLGIAQVLMENPDIIILDEPFNGIEEKSVEKISNILKEEKENGKLIIISTHIKEDLSNLSDKVYYFDNGRVSINIKEKSWHEICIVKFISAN